MRVVAAPVSRRESHDDSSTSLSIADVEKSFLCARFDECLVGCYVLLWRLSVLTSHEQAQHAFDSSPDQQQQQQQQQVQLSAPLQYDPDGRLSLCFLPPRPHMCAHRSCSCRRLLVLTAQCLHHTARGAEFPPLVQRWYGGAQVPAEVAVVEAAMLGRGRGEETLRRRQGGEEEREMVGMALGRMVGGDEGLEEARRAGVSQEGLSVLQEEMQMKKKKNIEKQQQQQGEESVDKKQQREPQQQQQQKEGDVKKDDDHNDDDKNVEKDLQQGWLDNVGTARLIMLGTPVVAAGLAIRYRKQLWKSMGDLFSLAFSSKQLTM